MRYYIFKNAALEETNDVLYGLWHETEWEKFALPAFYIKRGKMRYGLETLFVGAIDMYEDVLPFVPMYYEDERRGKKSAEPEYFATYEEMEERYEERKEKITMVMESAN